MSEKKATKAGKLAKKALTNAGKPGKPGKKDSQLIIRISGKERDEFVSLCEQLDTSAAREIRRFIRRFIADKADRKD